MRTFKQTDAFFVEDAIKAMKNYSQKSAKRGRTAYRSPSAFRERQAREIAQRKARRGRMSP